MKLRDFLLLFILISSSLTFGGSEIGESYHTFTNDVNDSENSTFLTDLSIISVEENHSGVIGSISNDQVLVTLLDGTFLAENRYDVDESGETSNFTSLTGEIHFYDADNYSNVTKIHIRGFRIWFSTDSASFVWHHDMIAVSMSFQRYFWIEGEKTICHLGQEFCGAIILFNQSGELVEIKTYPMRPTLLQTADGGAIWGLTGSYYSNTTEDPFNPGNISVGRVGENESFLETNISSYLFSSRSNLLLSEDDILILDHITVNPGNIRYYCGLSYSDRALVILNSADEDPCIQPIPIKHQSVITVDDSNRVTVFEGRNIINPDSGDDELTLTIGRLENRSELKRIGNVTLPGMRSVVKGCALNDGSSFILAVSDDRREGVRPYSKEFNHSIIFVAIDEENRSIHFNPLVNVRVELGRPSSIEQGIQLTECYSGFLRVSIIDGDGTVYSVGRHNVSWYEANSGRIEIQANVLVPYTGYSFNFTAPSVFFELRNYSEIPTQQIEFDSPPIPTENQSNSENNNSDNLSADGNNSSTSDEEYQTSEAGNNSEPIGNGTDENDPTSIESSDAADCPDDDSNDFAYPNDCNNGNSSGLDGDEAPVNEDGESTSSIDVYQIDERKAVLAGVGFVATFILLVLFLKKLQI